MTLSKSTDSSDEEMREWMRSIEDAQARIIIRLNKMERVGINISAEDADKGLFKIVKMYKNNFLDYQADQAKIEKDNIDACAKMGSYPSSDYESKLKHIDGQGVTVIATLMTQHLKIANEIRELNIVNIKSSVFMEAMKIKGHSVFTAARTKLQEANLIGVYSNPSLKKDNGPKSYSILPDLLWACDVDNIRTNGLAEQKILEEKIAEQDYERYAEQEQEQERYAKEQNALDTMKSITEEL